MSRSNKLGISAIGIAIIVIIGAMLRFWGILHGSFAFTFDVGRDLLAVNEIVNNHKLTLLGPTTGLPGVFYGPWWYYFLAIPFALSNGNPYIIVSSISIMGLLAVILLFMFGTTLWGRKFGLLLALFVAISHGFVYSSSQIWNPNLIQFFLPATLFFLWRLKDKGDILSVFLFGIFCGLTFEMEQAFGIFFLVGMTICFFTLVCRQKIIIKIVSYILGLFLVFLPRLLFDARHGFLISKNLFSFISNPTTRQVPLSFVQRIVNRGNLFYEQWFETFGGGNRIIGLIFLILIIIGLWKIRHSMASTTKTMLIISVIPIAVLYVGFVIYPDTVWSYYLAGLPILYIMFVFTVLAQIFSNYRRLRFMIIGLIVFIIILSSRPKLVIDSFRQPNFKGDAAVFRNQVRAVDYVYREAKGEPFNEIAYTPPVIDYTWQYLFLWHGKKYGYLPSKEKASKFYVIMEPDLEHPERLSNWLEVRIGDGKIIKEERLTGGITVQTRIH